MFTKLNTLYEDFLSFYEREGYSESTLENHRICLYKHIDPVIGDNYLRSLTPDKISHVKKQARKAGRSIPTRATITIRMILKYAENEGYTVGVDWQEIDVPRYSSKPDDVQYFNQKQLTIIRQAIPTDRPSGLRTRALFELLLHTGLRLSEALKLDKKDVDFQKQVVTALNTKQDEYSKLNVPEYALKWLNRYLESRIDDEKALFYVQPKCGGGGQRLGKETAHSYMKKLAKDTDLPCGHHILRRTFGTNLMRIEDVDPKTAQQIMRHKDIRTTMDHYVGINNKRVQKAIDKTASKLSCQK